MMRSETRHHLIALNRRFYQHHSQAFDGSRQRPWKGWQRLLQLLADVAAEGDPPTLDVLDAGCGNGRLATYLAQQEPRAVRYVGIDSSPALLAQAAQRQAVGELIEDDLVSQAWQDRLNRRRFHGVTSFGVLHHIPGLAQRRRFLRQLADRCRPGGLLVVSIWRLDQQPRFASKVLDWHHYLAEQSQARDVLDVDDLEAGDYLLTWSGNRSHPRYCHFPDDAEIDDWIDHLGLPVVDRWRADGAGGTTNLYLAFRP